MIPVVSVSVFSEQSDHFVVIFFALERLNVTLDFGIARVRVVPQYTDRRTPFESFPIPFTVCLITFD
jgi:hypothetical protein